MQSQAPVQLTNVPPPPTCSPGNLFTGADCQDRINLYNQAKQQRHQQDIIKNLQEQMQADATVALRAKSAAHTQGLQQGAGIGVGASLILFGVIYAVRRLTRSFTITNTKKPQARAASA